MGKPISRREFLRLAALSLGGLLLAGDRGPQFLVPKRFDPDLLIELDDNDLEVSFEEAAQLALLLGKAGKDLKLDRWRPPLNDVIYEAWIIEVLLQMQADKIIDTVTLPVRPYFFDPLEETDPLYKIGTSDCLTTAQLSNRLVNPLSPWYNSPDWPGSAVHENIHRTLQHDLCGYGASEQVENAANVLMLTVLAALANRGSGFAFRSFVWESLDISLGAAFSLAHQSNRLEDYGRLRARIHPGILSQSRFEKINREFLGNEAVRFERLAKYSLMPLATLLKAHLTNQDLVNDLYIAPRRIYSTGTDYGSSPVSAQRVISIADWVWTMSHLRDMTSAFAALPPDFTVLR